MIIVVVLGCNVNAVRFNLNTHVLISTIINDKASARACLEFFLLLKHTDLCLAAMFFEK